VALRRLVLDHDNVGAVLHSLRLQPPVGDADKYSQNVRVQANTHDVICQRAVACHASEHGV